MQLRKQSEFELQIFLVKPWTFDIGCSYIDLCPPHFILHVHTKDFLW